MEKSIFFHFDCLTTSLGQNFPKFTKDKIMGDTFIIGYMTVMSENITHKRHNKEKQFVVSLSTYCGSVCHATSCLKPALTKPLHSVGTSRYNRCAALRDTLHTEREASFPLQQLTTAPNMNQFSPYVEVGIVFLILFVRIDDSVRYISTYPRPSFLMVLSVIALQRLSIINSLAMSIMFSLRLTYQGMSILSLG